MRSEESESVRLRPVPGVDGGRRSAQTGAELRQSPRRGRKRRRTAGNRLSAATTGTYEDIFCVSAVTADSYTIHMGDTPGLHRSLTAPTPSEHRVSKEGRRPGGMFATLAMPISCAPHRGSLYAVSPSSRCRRKAMACWFGSGQMPFDIHRFDAYHRRGELKAALD